MARGTSQCCEVVVSACSGEGERLIRRNVNDLSDQERALRSEAKLHTQDASSMHLGQVCQKGRCDQYHLPTCRSAAALRDPLFHSRGAKARASSRAACRQPAVRSRPCCGSGHPSSASRDVGSRADRARAGSDARRRRHDLFGRSRRRAWDSALYRAFACLSSDLEGESCVHASLRRAAGSARNCLGRVVGLHALAVPESNRPPSVGEPPARAGSNTLEPHCP